MLLAALIVAGCGSSSSNSSTSSSAAASTTTTTTAASTATSAPAAAAAIVITTKKDKLGTVLAAGPKNLTVYLWEADKGASSTCSGPCAKVWPPVTTSGKPTAGKGALASLLGTTPRPDGTTQVTYKGHPLYYFAKDKDAGDSYGQGSKSFGAGWYVLAPSGNKIDKS
jgi:predicted lipoprotein with Yx(FWY)xxD motif